MNPIPSTSVCVYDIPIPLQCLLQNLQRQPRLLLHLPQPLRRRLRPQESLQPLVDLGAELGEALRGILGYRRRVSMAIAGHAEDRVWHYRAAAA